MKTIWQTVLAIGIVAGVCLCYAPQAKQQLEQKAQAKEQIGSVQQHPMPGAEKAGQWELITTDNKLFSGRLREGNMGTFIINDDGEVLIPRDMIKSVKQVTRNGSTNSGRDGGDVQRNPKDR